MERSIFCRGASVVNMRVGTSVRLHCWHCHTIRGSRFPLCGRPNFFIFHPPPCLLWLLFSHNATRTDCSDSSLHSVYYS